VRAQRTVGTKAAQRARHGRMRIISAEAPPEQEGRRGRWFVRIYTSLIILASIAFVLLALQARTKQALRLDLTLARAIQGVHVPLYGWVLTRVSDLGFFPGNVISYVVVFAVLFLLGLRLESGLAVGSALIASLVGSIIRASIGRPRPSGSLVHVVMHVSGLGFPSGHVIHYVTLFGFCFYVVLTAWRSSLLRNLTLAVLFPLVILVGPSRVYLGAHWPSDVLGAYLFGAVWLAGTVELYLILIRRRGIYATGLRLDR